MVSWYTVIKARSAGFQSKADEGVICNTPVVQAEEVALGLMTRRGDLEPRATATRQEWPSSFAFLYFRSVLVLLPVAVVLTRCLHACNVLRLGEKAANENQPRCSFEEPPSRRSQRIACFEICFEWIRRRRLRRNCKPPLWPADPRGPIYVYRLSPAL